MMKRFARTQLLPPYVFAVVNQLKAEARIRHEDIIDFGMGNPDQPTPKHIIAKLQESAARDDTHRYSQSKGIKNLRRAISDWYGRKYSVDINPETEALVTIGSKEGLTQTAFTLTTHGDIVLVPTPTYPIHTFAFTLAGAAVAHLLMHDTKTFLQELKSYLHHHQGGVQALLLNFPANPSALCVDLDFYAEVVSLARHYQFWIIQDFAYAELCFDGYQPPSILQVPGSKEVAIETYSLSKTFNMAGWRVGFICGNHEAITQIGRLKSYVDYGMYTPIQIAAIEALNGDQSCVTENRLMYQERRNILCEGLNRIGWEVEVPRGTMFVWARIPKDYAHLKSLEFAKFLLKEAKVAVSPGIGFGQAGDEFVRFGLIENQERIRQAIRNLKPLFTDKRRGTDV